MNDINEIMEILYEKLPMVEWDRYIECPPEKEEDGYLYDIYGWIPNQKRGRDFVYLIVNAKLGEDAKLIHYATSSAKYSREMHEQMFGTVEGHRDCKKVPAKSKLDRKL